ncbi:hypothetical protein Droror1_Dr00004708 [Drosera rotundifolia]
MSSSSSSSSSSSCSRKAGSRCHLRSITLPSKSNPMIQSIEGELIKLRAREESSTSTTETINIGLSGLVDLYKSIDAVLSLPLTQQSLSLHQYERCIHGLLETSLILLDTCSATRELVMQLKEVGRELGSTLRRRKGDDDSSIEGHLTSYVSSRKRIAKSANALASSLKRVDINFGTLDNADHHRLSMLTKALRCVTIINMSVYESLLFFLSMPVARPSKWSSVSRMLSKRVADCEEQAQKAHELRDVDVAIGALCRGNKVEGEKVQLAAKRLEILEAGMEGIENGLDAMYRQLIRTRASLLNIMSS